MKDNNLTAEKLLASYQEFSAYVNSQRYDLDRLPLADDAMVVAYATCHEFWDMEKRLALVARLRMLL